MLIVDHYETGTFKTSAIIEEVDVYYAQEIFIGLFKYYGFKIFDFLQHFMVSRFYFLQHIMVSRYL